MGSIVVSIMTDYSSPVDPLQSDGETLPPVYIVSDIYDTPVKDQGNERSSSWLFAFVGLLESLFRSHNSNKNEYIKFSEQAFGKALYDACQGINQNSTLCRFSQLPNRISGPVSLIPDFVVESPSIGNFLYPESVCPYQTTEEQNTYCPPLAPNPLSFKVTDIAYSNTVKGIKELVYTRKQPILFQMPELYADHFVDCSDNRMSDKAECTDGTIKCPYNHSANCGILRFPARTSSGTYFVPDPPSRPTVGDPVNFLLLGYADDFVSSRGLVHLPSQKHTRGGFIVKAAHSAQHGFPLNFYKGELSFSKTYTVCPNMRAPEQWLGNPVTCMRSHQDFEKCPAVTPPPEHYFSSVAKATELRCINKRHCDEGVYALTQLPLRTRELYVLEEESGLTTTPIYRKFDDSYSEIAFDDVPFYMLDQVFEPIALENNDEQQCGYWFIPYEVVHRVNAFSKEAFNNVMGVAVDVEFSTTKLSDVEHAFKTAAVPIDKRMVNTFET